MPIRLTNINITSDIEKLRLDYPEIADVLTGIVREIITVRSVILEPSENLNRRTRPSVLEGTIYPRSSNQPPLSQPAEGLTFFNTSRKRFQKSFDTWAYYDYPTPEGCRLFRSTDQSINNNALTAVSFDTEIWDHIACADLTAAATRITFPISGRYLVTGHCVFEANATGYRNGTIRLNGTTLIAPGGGAAIATAAIPTPVVVTTIHEFVAGDYVEFLVIQNSGGALNVLTAAAYSPIFTAHRLG